MNKSILIVEDNLIASKVQKSIIESLGFAVDCARTGEEGVYLAHKNKYALILMDLGLPGIDGLETIKQIKGENLKVDNTLTPIEVVTANEDPFIREQCLQAGIVEVLSKPFTPIKAKELLVRFFPNWVA